MRFVISDSNKHKIETEMSWLFISSKLDAIIFLCILSIVVIGLAIIEFVAPTQEIVNQFNPTKYNRLELTKMTNEFNDEGINVLLLGGSTSRELTGLNSVVSQSLTSSCGKEVNFVNAGFSNQTYVASRTLFSEYKRYNVDLVIIGMNYYRLILNPEVLKTNIMDSGELIPAPLNLISEKAIDTHLLPAIKPIFLSAKLYDNYYKKKDILLKDNSDNYIPNHNFYHKPAMSKEEKEKVVRRFLISRYPDYIRHADFGSENWISFSKYAQSEGSTVMFLALPEDPSMKEIRPFFTDRFNQFLAKSREEGTKIVNWHNNSLNLVPEDFYDQQHLKDTGRKKVLQPLVNVIIEHLPECNINE